MANPKDQTKTKVSYYFDGRQVSKEAFDNADPNYTIEGVIVPKILKLGLQASSRDEMEGMKKTIKSLKREAIARDNLTLLSTQTWAQKVSPKSVTPPPEENLYEEDEKEFEEEGEEGKDYEFHEEEVLSQYSDRSHGSSGLGSTGSEGGGKKKKQYVHKSISTFSQLKDQKVSIPVHVEQDVRFKPDFGFIQVDSRLKVKGDLEVLKTFEKLAGSRQVVNDYGRATRKTAFG